MPEPTRSLARTVITENPPNEETPLAALLHDLTPRGLFYVRSNFPLPELDPASFRLAVGGAVERPEELGLDELRSLAAVETATVTLECAGNARLAMDPVPAGTAWGWGAASTARFTGLPLVRLLERVGLRDEAVEIVFSGADAGEVEPGRVVRFERSLPVADALREDVLLAWEMNGEPLPREHGFPLRLVVPGWYGVASVKWLAQIEAVREPFSGHFQVERYVYSEEEGTPEGTPVREMRVRSLIARPGQGATLAVGRPVEIAGVAWSGYGEILRVEVSTDGGTVWRQAHLGPNGTCAPSAGVACSWRLPWAPAEAGPHSILARATDSAGSTQPLGQRWNRLGYGNNLVHRIDVEVV